MQPLVHLLLVRCVLRRETEQVLYAQLRQLLVVVAEGARLRRAASGAGDVLVVCELDIVQCASGKTHVPRRRDHFARCARARVAEDYRQSGE